MKHHKRIILMTLFAFGLCVRMTYSQGGSALARADFGDLATDRIRSDGNSSPCGYDYADVGDQQCPDQAYSTIAVSQGTYRLRTVVNHSQNPTRWLVLDFSQPADTSTCLNLDQLILNDPNRDPNSNPPLNTDQCVDWVEVRLYADKAFNNRASFTPFEIIIDGPDLVQLPGGKGTRTTWNAKYELEFVNPLAIRKSLDGNTVMLDTMGDAAAELWKADRSQKLGTYNMPFRVTLTRVP